MSPTYYTDTIKISSTLYQTIKNLILYLDNLDLKIKDFLLEQIGHTL